MNEENISNQDLEASSNNTFDLALRPKKLNDFIGQKKVQDNLSLLAKFHNYKNMMADYASKSEDHAHHAQKMHNSLELLNHAWRDNMIE